MLKGKLFGSGSTGVEEKVLVLPARTVVRVLKTLFS